MRNPDDPPTPPPDGDEATLSFDGGDDSAKRIGPYRLPDQIGPYRLLKRIGEGGMGIVFLAEQREPIQRKVALKVMKPGLDSKEVIARFESERQALAVMNHASVATIIDAGSTDEGLPFFVMEYVPGVPFTEFCDRQRLDLRGRLRLFIQVCEAIHHAHQKGIIHRDIKPSNVLVALQDGKPIPKVIDFGVAKATERPLTEKTLFTEQGRMIGTPAYMSPEQAKMTGLGIDTTSDVYSLGVLLYEVLVGELPFTPEELREAGLLEIHRLIREVTPPKPSVRISSLGERTPELAETRRLQPVAWVKQVDGELDWITMRALEKDRTRRYQSADALREDIDKYLKGDAVSARPPSIGYRIQVFTRRNKVLVGGVVSVLAVLLVATIVSLNLYYRSVAARNQAERRFDIAREGADLLLDGLVHELPTVLGNSRIRRKLLGPAQAHYENLAAERPDDAD